MSENVFIVMCIGIDIFLAAIWLGVLDIRDRAKHIERRLEEKEESESRQAKGGDET